jgi:hypothetical protein
MCCFGLNILWIVWIVHLILVINNIQVTLTDLEGKVDKTKYVNEHVMNFKSSNHHIPRVNKTFENGSQCKYVGTSATSRGSVVRKTRIRIIILGSGFLLCTIFSSSP